VKPEKSDDSKKQPYHITQMQLKDLIKQLGLHEQDGVNGIGEDLEKKYLALYLEEEERKKRFAELLAEESPEESTWPKKSKKSKEKKEVLTKYQVGPFNFN
jgi:hypothetical protein